MPLYRNSIVSPPPILSYIFFFRPITLSPSPYNPKDGYFRTEVINESISSKRKRKQEEEKHARDFPRRFVGVRQSAWHLALKLTGTEITRGEMKRKKQAVLRNRIYIHLASSPHFFFSSSSSLFPRHDSFLEFVQRRADPSSRWQIIGW